MIKIVFIGPLPPPFGGVSIINSSFQKMRLEDFQIISFNTSNNKNREDLYRKFPWKNIFNELKKLKEFYFFIKKIKPSVSNIFVTSGYSILRDCLLLIVLKSFHIPTIVHFHSKKKNEYALVPYRLKILGRFFNRFTDKIILLSQDHFNHFTKYFPIGKCTIIENFVDYNDFECEIADKNYDFLFIGRLSREKGFFDLLEAVKILKSENFEFTIHVLGTAANLSDEDLIKRIVSKYDLSYNFIFHGTKSGAEKFNLFKRTRFLIFPSHFENSPLVIKEAIAAKMGIIASDIEANKLILSNKNNSIFHEVGKSESLANAIKSVLMIVDNGRDLCQASAKILDYNSNIAEIKINKLINELI
jgi:glycosyltransferase involved in cell wall biosynthesis